MKTENNYRIEDLQYSGLKIYQSPDLYCFTSDAVTLANFVKAKKADKVCELCAGGGVISILVGAKNKPQSIVGVELQHEMAEMFKDNVKLNNIKNIEVIEGDLCDFAQEAGADSFDVVICNPPYKDKNQAFKNENQIIAIARHEIKIDLETLLKSVSRILKYGGNFFISYDANRSAELITELKRNKLEPKRIFFTQPSANKNASLVFVEAKKGGKNGVIVLPTVISNDKDGKYIQNIFDNYRRK